MEKVLLLYKNDHASHRVVSSTMDNYNRYNSNKRLLDLHRYCIGKLGATRLDRYLLKEKFDAIYVHEEHIETIQLLEDMGIKYVTYTRADFCIYWKNYNNISNVKYTLLKEIIHKQKQVHGKVKVYCTNGQDIISTMKFKCDLEANRGRYFESYTEAAKEQIMMLEKSQNTLLKKTEWYEEQIQNNKDSFYKNKNKIKNLKEEILKEG